MKKSTLVLAVAAALTGFGSVAVADTTLYGSARVSIDYVDIDKPAGFLSDSIDYWDVFNDSSRLGVRGEEDLGGGLSAIYQYEFGVDLTDGGNFNSNRPKWVGLKGGFGAVTLGTQWSAYYNVTGVADIFNSSRTFATDTGYLGGQYGHRLDNTVLYTSPNMSGFTAQAMLVMNGVQNDGRTPDVSDGVDLWQVAGVYSNGPFYAGAAFMQLQDFDNNAVFDSDNRQGWAVVGAYKPGPFTIGLLYEGGDLNNISLSGVNPLDGRDTWARIGDVEDTNNYYLFGSYKFGNNEIKAAYVYTDPDGKYGLVRANGTVRPGTEQSFDTIQNLLLGYQYNFSKRTRVWIEYLGRQDDNDGALNTIKGDQNIVSIGTRHDF
ncbi:MAG: porin [Gammaproteobacteria bacterium]|nr:porin [Gammaproteobacteria bacterium]